MTEEELSRFALVLREADRVRAQISRDEAARADADSGLRQPPAAGEQSFEPAMVAAA